MVKLKETLAAKAGKWFSVPDVIGIPFMVTEDFGAEYDIRVTEDGKYFCLQVSDGKEVKDMHLARGALRAVADAITKTGNGKGQRFQVNAISGKGYQTKTHVSLLTGDYTPEKQTRLPQDVPTPAVSVPVQTAPGVAKDDMTVFLGAISGMQDGHVSGDDALMQLAVMVCNGDVTKADFMLRILKSGHCIQNDGGCWSVVK